MLAGAALKILIKITFRSYGLKGFQGGYILWTCIFETLFVGERQGRNLCAPPVLYDKRPDNFYVITASGLRPSGLSASIDFSRLGMDNRRL
jgi:hypothetical protein